MSQSTVLTSFAELADVLDLSALPDGPSPQATAAETMSDDLHPLADLQEVLTQIEVASGTLAAISRRDQEARAVALRDLERYDEVVGQLREAEQARDQARQVRGEAEQLAESAFAAEARAEASRVAAIAAQAEEATTRAVEEWQREVETLATRLDLERLLAERRRQEEAEKAQAAETERARRLVGALARARVALDAGRLEEARGLLGAVATQSPNNPEITSLTTIIAKRELAVNVDTVETALWEARREYRRNPGAAVARLERLDIGLVPEPLARQVFGEWARACARLCRERRIAEPLRYAPDPGRGAVIAREQPDSSYVVVSAVGMGPSWKTGAVVDERQVPRARPLR